MYRSILIITLILILGNRSSLFAEATWNIYGSVLDEISGDRLAGANIYIDGTSLGVTSNSDGNFSLSSLPAGSYALQVDYVGYSRQTHQIHLAAADTNLVVRLNQDILNGPVVTVSATQAHQRVSAITFSELDKKSLKARHTVQDMPELLAEMPSTTFYSETGSGLGYNYLSIRGFGQRRISVMINGIPQNDPEDHNTYWVNFPDLAANVQQIQVQRGAGGAFYGPAAIGGSINILTNYFSPQPKFSAYAGIGAYNTRKLSMSYNTGIIKDKYVFFGRFSNIKTDGYRKRGWIDFSSYFLGGAYYDKNQNLRLHFYGGPIKDGLIYNGLPKFVNDDTQLRRQNYSYWEADTEADTITYATDRRKDEVENFNQPHVELLHEYKISRNLTLNNALFYIRGYGYFDYDGAWVNYYSNPQEYFRLTPEYGFSDTLSIPWDTLIRAYVDNNQIGWLPQLSWKNGKEELVLGAELRVHRSLHWGRLQKGSNLPDDAVGSGARHYYEYKGSKNIASVYLHQAHEIRRNLIFMGDLQYTFKRYRLYDEKFLDNDFSIDYQFLNPRVGLNYNLSSIANTYISLSHTSREPRLKNYYDAAEGSTPEAWGLVQPQFELNADSSYNFNKPVVKPEHLTGLELGYVMRTEKFHGFINLYHMAFVDEIIKSGALDRFGQPITGNADYTVHQGIELGGQIQFIPQLALSGNFSYSSNKLIFYSYYRDDGSVQNLDGNVIAGFPNMLGNLRLTYAWNGLTTSVAGRYMGKMYTDNFENEENTMDLFTVFNFNFNWKLEQIGIKGIIIQAQLNNVLNTNYLAHGEGDAYFPAATRNGFIGLRFEY